MKPKGVFVIEHKSRNLTFQIHVYMPNVKRVSDLDVELVLIGLEHEILHYVFLKNGLVEADEKLDGLYERLGNYKKWADEEEKQKQKTEPFLECSQHIHKH